MKTSDFKVPVHLSLPGRDRCRSPNLRSPSAAASSARCCMFSARRRCFLLLELLAVRCVGKWGREHVWKQRRHIRGGGGGGGWVEDEGTGVEFTHPAGSAHYWHICLAVMSHPCYCGGEIKWGFLNMRDGWCWYVNLQSKNIKQTLFWEEKGEKRWEKTNYLTKKIHLLD